MAETTVQMNVGLNYIKRRCDVADLQDTTSLKAGGNQVAKPSELAKGAGILVGIIVAGIVAVWLILWLLCFGMFTSVSINAYSRCTVRGYTDDEIIVNYPKFWHGDTICYNGKDLKNGIKL
jgi:hypothetical protein